MSGRAPGPGGPAASGIDAEADLPLTDPAETTDAPETPGIHHVSVVSRDPYENRAFYAALDAWRDRLTEAGITPSRVRDRHYFHSLYVRDPGGILFELSTDGPGLTRDESVEELGSALRLPPGLADDEAMIREQLPPLDEPVRRGREAAADETERPATPEGER